MNKSTAVYEALLARDGVSEQVRRDAIAALAKSNSRSPLGQLVASLETLKTSG